MRPSAEHSNAMALIQQGTRDCEVARMTGVPRSTVRDWRQGRGIQGRAKDAACPVCTSHEAGTFPRQDYAYLLGMYLGDGDISMQTRTPRLRISLDLKWPGVVTQCADALRAVLPHNAVAVYQPDQRSSCIVVSVYSKHLACLFPQQGTGPKHLRSIVLHAWQAEIAREQPANLLRGLLHSDGCRFVNRVRIDGKQYEYPRYNFTNASSDILRIFTATCDRLGIEWRRMGYRDISIARRASVDRTDLIGGAKS